MYILFIYCLIVYIIYYVYIYPILIPDSHLFRFSTPGCANSEPSPGEDQPLKKVTFSPSQKGETLNHQKLQHFLLGGFTRWLLFQYVRLEGMTFRLGEFGIKCQAVHSVSAISNGNAKVLGVRRALKRHHKTENLTDQRVSLSGSKMSNASCRARVPMLYELRRMANK